MVALAEAAADDHSVTIVLSILGIIYGLVAIGIFFAIILPRVIASSVASAIGRSTVAGASAAVRSARPPASQGLRWWPSYNRSAYMPRNELQLQRMSQPPNALRRRFPALNQVSLYAWRFSFHLSVAPV